MLFLFKFNVESERTNLLDQHVEGFRHAGIHVMVSVNDVLVHLGTAVDVIGLHGKHFLQGVGGTVGFQCPDLHFPETLSTELRLATQRLLRDQAVRTG